MHPANPEASSRAAGAEGFSSPHGYQPLGGRPFGAEPPSPIEAASEFFRDYARQRPEVVAMWAFGVGFVLGWKLKPW